MARRDRIPAPAIPALRLVDLTDTDPGRIGAGGYHEGHRYIQADLAGRDLADAVFSECEFVGVEAHDADLRGARILETRMERLNAPVLRAPRSAWHDVHLDGSRLGALELNDADLRSVAVTTSRLGFINLRSATLQDVRLTDCVIDELDLTGARAERVAFEGCTVGVLVLDHARLRHVDLRDLDLRTVSGVDSLRGAVISPAQAAELAQTFAAHLGITVTADADA